MSHFLPVGGGGSVPWMAAKPSGGPTGRSGAVEPEVRGRLLYGLPIDTGRNASVEPLLTEYTQPEVGGLGGLAEAEALEPDAGSAGVVKQPDAVAE